MTSNIYQCSRCGFIAAVPHPGQLAGEGWRLKSEGHPNTYCPECAGKLGVGQPVTPPLTRAAGQRARPA
jgi:hypothetical protein